MLLDSAVDLISFVSAEGSVNDSENFDKERMLRDRDMGHGIDDYLIDALC